MAAVGDGRVASWARQYAGRKGGREGGEKGTRQAEGFERELRKEGRKGGRQGGSKEDRCLCVRHWKKANSTVSLPLLPSLLSVTAGLQNGLEVFGRSGSCSCTGVAWQDEDMAPRLWGGPSLRRGADTPGCGYADVARFVMMIILIVAR